MVGSELKIDVLFNELIPFIFKLFAHVSDLLVRILKDALCVRYFQR